MRQHAGEALLFLVEIGDLTRLHEHSSNPAPGNLGGADILGLDGEFTTSPGWFVEKPVRPGIEPMNLWETRGHDRIEHAEEKCGRGNQRTPARLLGMKQRSSWCALNKESCWCPCTTSTVSSIPGEPLVRRPA